MIYIQNSVYRFVQDANIKTAVILKKFVKLDSIEDYQEKIWKEPLRITKNNPLVSIPRRKTGGFVTVFPQIMKGERND